MSYSILYNWQFLKSAEGITPVILIGDNNVTTRVWMGNHWGERRARGWACLFNVAGVSEEKFMSEIKNMTGKELEKMLDEVNITANKNTIPFETTSPFVTSGVRIGTPCATTRGLGVAEMDRIAACIYDAATNFDAKADAIRAAVAEICAAHPLYQ